MFDIGSFELVVILILGVIILGPNEVKSMAKFMGKTMRKFQGLASDFKDDIKKEVDGVGIMDEINNLKSEVETITEGGQDDLKDITADIKDLEKSIGNPTGKNTNKSH